MVFGKFLGEVLRPDLTAATRGTCCGWDISGGDVRSQLGEWGKGAVRDFGAEERHSIGGSPEGSEL